MMSLTTLPQQSPRQQQEQPNLHLQTPMLLPAPMQGAPPRGRKTREKHAGFDTLCSTTTSLGMSLRQLLLHDQPLLMLPKNTPFLSRSAPLLTVRSHLWILTTLHYLNKVQAAFSSNATFWKTLKMHRQGNAFNVVSTFWAAIKECASEMLPLLHHCIVALWRTKVFESFFTWLIHFTFRESHITCVRSHLILRKSKIKYRLNPSPMLHFQWPKKCIQCCEHLLRNDMSRNVFWDHSQSFNIL